jgi:Tol biopolymer transport system component
VQHELDEIVGRLLQKNRDLRFTDSRQVVVALVQLLATTSATPSSPRGRVISLKWAAAGAAVVLAVALPLFLFRPTGVGSLEIARTWQVTHAPGLEADPDLSPDGTLLAYSSGQEGQMRIHVRQIQGGNTITLTDGVPGNHRWPRWSPDGSQILFQSENGVFVVPSLGGFAGRLVDPGPGNEVYGADWSPDGASVVYAQADTVYIRDVQSRVVRSEFSTFEPHSLSWSPNGRHLAYVSGSPFFVFGASTFANLGASVVWIYTFDRNQQHRVTPEAGQSVSPAWAPDGKSLMWVSNVGGSRDVYHVDIAASGAPRGDPDRLTTGLDARSISISEDGRRVAYSLFHATANVWSVALSAAGPVSVADAVPITRGNQRIESINVSPDEEWIAFDSDLAGNQDIYILPLSGGEAAQLTTNTADDFTPSWSPDGKSVAFHSFRDGNRELYTVSTDDRTEERVTVHPSQDRAPDWSPDGRRMVFFSDRTGRQELFVVDQESGGWGDPRQLTFDGGLHAEWSPNSELIAYISGSQTHGMTSNVHELRLVSTDGKSPVVLLAAEELGLPVPEALEWSVDGRFIFYKAFDKHGAASIWRVPISGADPELVVRFDDPRRRTLYRHELAVDGGHVYFTLGDFESDIWMMEFSNQE